MGLPNVHAIVLKETDERSWALAEHLDQEGIEWTPFRGVNAESWGLTTLNKYDKDGTNVTIPQKHVGLHLSHYWLWRQCMTSEDYERYGDESQFTIIEDDCRFVADWRENLALASRHVPADWDMVLLGSCCTEDKPTVHLGGNVFSVKYPLCTHAYIVRGKALPLLADTQEKSWASIDLALYWSTYPKLNVYTILPRIAEQEGMVLPV